MSGTNEILPFASDVSANVLSQSAYNADSQRLIGNQPGIARAQLVNKCLRQMSVMMTGFGQFIANRQANNITDSLTPTQVEDYLQAALASRSTIPPNLSASAQSWWRKSSDGFIEQGISGINVPNMGGFTDITFPIPFTVACIDIQIGVVSAATQQLGWANITLTGARILTGNSDPGARIANVLVRGW